jgi:hypothetical protein
MAKGADKAVPAVPTAKVAKQQAISRVAETPVAPATIDDWGWKGGKPGEISGDVMYRDLTTTRPGSYDFHDQVDYLNNEVLDSFARKYPNTDYAAYQKMATKGNAVPNPDRLIDLVTGFKVAQEAGIPRAWTGKVMGALDSKTREFWSADDIRDLSSVLKPLSNADREAVVASIPTWTRSIPELGTFIKQLSTLSASQQDTARSLLPEWYGTIDELINAAKTL